MPARVIAELTSVQRHPNSILANLLAFLLSVSKTCEANHLAGASQMVGLLIFQFEIFATVSFFCD